MPAYVDESGRVCATGACYVLAAVLVPGQRAEPVRLALRALLRRDQRRIHWHAERASSRTALAAAVGALDLRAVAVVAPSVEGRKWERARRQCLVRLMWELEQRAERVVVLESRAGRRDLEDARLLVAARRSGHAGRGVHYRFVRPTDEPLLWVADIVAGVVGVATLEGDTRFLDLLGDRVSVIALP
jgi:hypothetical protein